MRHSTPRVAIWSVALLIGSFVTAPAAHALGLDYGARAEYRWTNLIDDTTAPDSGAVPGVAAGLGVRLGLLLVDIELDVLYAQKGGLVTNGGDVTLSGAALEAPLGVRFEIPGIPFLVSPYLEAGVAPGLLLGDPSVELGAGASDPGLGWNRTYVDFNAGAGLAIGLPLIDVLIGGRFFHSLGDVTTTGGKWHGWSLSAAILF